MITPASSHTDLLLKIPGAVIGDAVYTTCVIRYLDTVIQEQAFGLPAGDGSSQAESLLKAVGYYIATAFMALLETHKREHGLDKPDDDKQVRSTNTLVSCFHTNSP